MFTLRRIFLVGLIASMILAGVFVVNLWVFIETPAETGAETLVVERGMSPRQVIETLHDRKLISNIPLFRFHVLLKGASSRLRAGEYLFPPRITPAEILDLLLKGDFATRRITIPEGWTAREIAGILEKMKMVNADRFLQKCGDPVFIQSLGLSTTSLEGYLFPDTYEIYKPKDEEEVLKKLVGRFQEVYSKEFDARAREIGMSQGDVITLASIVEKETGREEERGLIASVFLNRLKIGMPLATDPVVIYGIPNFSGNLTRKDLTTPGPYNTYVNVGLPPTAISNPGAESIRAVLWPATTDYLYFVSRNDGIHQFSKTVEEHNAAVKKYQINRPR